MSSCNCDDPSLIPTVPPTYVYKLVPFTQVIPTQATDLPLALPVSDVDAHSGFIHLSTAPQIPGTLARFFVSEPSVYVLRLPYAPLSAPGGTSMIRWERPEEDVCGPRVGEGAFPHLYNGLRVGREEVDSVWVLRRGEGLGWKEAVEKDTDFTTWLVY